MLIYKSEKRFVLQGCGRKSQYPQINLPREGCGRFIGTAYTVEVKDDGTITLRPVKG